MDVPPRVAAKSNQAHQPSWRAALRYQHATQDRDKVIAEALGQPPKMPTSSYCGPIESTALSPHRARGFWLCQPSSMWTASTSITARSKGSSLKWLDLEAFCHAMLPQEDITLIVTSPLTFRERFHPTRR